MTKQFFRNALFLLHIFLLCCSCTEPEKLQDKKIDSLVRLARVEMSNMKYVKTINFAKEAEVIALQNAREEKLPEVYLEIADGLAGLGLQKESFYYLNRILKENFQGKDDVFKARVYQIFAYNYSEIGLDTQFLHHNRKAIHLLAGSNTYPEMFFLSQSYGNLGYYYYSKKNSDSSFYYYKKQESVLTSFPEKQSQYAVHNLAALYNAKGYLFLEYTKERDSALFYFKKGLELRTKYNFSSLDIEYLGFGDYYFSEKKYSEALVFYLKAQQNSRIYNREAGENNDVNKVLADTYDALNDSEKASLYLRKFTKYNDSIQQVRDTHLDTVVDLLVKRNSEESTSAIRNSSTIILLGVISAAVLIGGVFFYRIRKTKNKVALKNEKLLNERENMIIQKEEEANELKLRVNESFIDVIQLAKDNSTEFFTRFEEVYPEVIARLLQIDGKLRVTELTLCAYFYLGFTTKDVAFYTFKSINTVRNRRQSLRSKLNIEKDANLELWFKNLKKP